MEPPASDVLVDQRLRNRLIEEAMSWAEGEKGVHRAGPGEHFASFFDWRDLAKARESTTLTVAEAAKADELSALIEQGYADFTRDMSVDSFVATGWPKCIKPVAIELFDLLMDGGRFFENDKEAEELADWPWFDRNPLPGSRHYARFIQPAPRPR